MDFSLYDFDPAIYDEMFVAEGEPREHCRAVVEALRELPDDDLNTVQERVTRSFSQEGITFTVYGDEEAEERIIPIDCVPRLLALAEWRELEAGLVQRIRTLSAGPSSGRSSRCPCCWPRSTSAGARRGERWAGRACCAPTMPSRLTAASTGSR